MTISFGIAAFPDHGMTERAVLRAADASLYRAKQGGRNRVEVAVDPAADAPDCLFPALQNDLTRFP